MRVIGGSQENQMIVVEDRKRRSGSEGTFGDLSMIGDRTGNRTIFNEGVREASAMHRPRLCTWHLFLL